MANNSIPTPPFAQSTPQAPQAHVAPQMPQAPTIPQAPQAPVAPQMPQAPTIPQAPQAPVAPQAPQAPVAPQAVAPAMEVKKEKKKRNKPMTTEQIQYIVANIKSFSYQEMADKLEISKAQVNRVLQDIKTRMRNRAIENAQAEGKVAYPSETTAKGKQKLDYSNPQTEYAQKVENHISTNLSRPEDTRPGKGKKGGGVATALDNQVESILNSL